jgi:hypothetical protein
LKENAGRTRKAKFVTALLITLFLVTNATPTYAWRLFGWDSWEFLGTENSTTPDGSQCFSMVVRNYYFFGFVVDSEVAWNIVPCKTTTGNIDNKLKSRRG